MNTDSLRSREKKILFQMVEHYWVDENHIANMEVDAFAVYTVIRRHAGAYGTNAFPSYDTLQTKTGLTRKRISAALQRLIQLDYIEVEKEKVKTGERNIYTVLDSSKVKKGNKISNRKPPQKKKDELEEEPEIADVAKARILNFLTEVSVEHDEAKSAIEEMDRLHRYRDYYWCVDVMKYLQARGKDELIEKLKVHKPITILNSLYLGDYPNLDEAA